MKELTEMEKRVVVCLAQTGATNAEIGKMLHMATGTVKTHLRFAMLKLGVKNRTALAAIAWKEGWVMSDVRGGDDGKR